MCGSLHHLKHQVEPLSMLINVLVGFCMVLTPALPPQATEPSCIQFLLLLRHFLELNYFLGLQTFA